MSNPSMSDNIAQLGNGPFVFDPASSNIRTLPTHNTSFVLPMAPGSDRMKTTIYSGDVVYMQFADGGVVQKPASVRKGISLHGDLHPLSEWWMSVHSEGCEAAVRAKSSSEIAVLGAETQDYPSLLVLDYVHIKLDKALQAREVKAYTEMVEKINAATGRNLLFRHVPGADVIAVPASWILQDLEAIRRQKKKATPIIKRPVVFPVVGSKIVYSDQDGEHQAIIQDFDIISGGSKTEVRIGEEDGEGIFLRYSNIYAASEKELLNPCISRVVTPEKLAGLKTSYLDEAREIIRKALGNWNVWAVRGMKVLAMVSQDSRTNGRGKVKWMFPLESISAKDVHVVSFESGTAVVDDVLTEVYLKEKPEFEAGHIYYHSLEEANTLKSMYYNAVIGTAYSLIGSKKVEAYFSTKNAKNISIDGLFRPMEPIDRVSIDVINIKWVLGYLGKSTEEGHEDQTVLYWAQVPEAFRAFYFLIISRGEHEMFKNKTVAQRRAMIECPEFPELVDIFNFITYGVDAKNPTRDSAWTRTFVKNYLLIDIEELL